MTPSNAIHTPDEIFDVFITYIFFYVVTNHESY